MSGGACEECSVVDGAELPKPMRTITNAKFEGVLEIEQAFREAHDYVSELPPEELRAPEPQANHGEWRGNKRYCVCCNKWADGFNNPNECPGRLCGAPWDRSAAAQP